MIAKGRKPLESATTRLSRLLALVPWVLHHQGVPLADAAAAFDVTEAQLIADLELLFVCGTPGHLPDDLIEAEWEDGKVFIGNAEAIARPLRLSIDEAVTLIVGLKMLATAPGVEGAVDRALAKLEAATGGLTEPIGQRLHVDLDAAGRHLATAREGIETQRRLRMRYFVQGRDEVTERDVDPMRVVNLDSHWYLEGYCHLAHDTRLFRVDRIEELALLDIDGSPPRDALRRDLAEGSFAPRPTDEVAIVDTDAHGAWIAEYYPTEETSALPDGGVRATLRVADPAWLVRLVARLGGHAQIVSPSHLREAVAEHARTALTAYGETPARFR